MTANPADPDHSDDVRGGPQGKPAGPLGSVLAYFDPAGVPAGARVPYRRELKAAFFFPFVLVMFEGSVLSVLVRILFEDSVEKAILNPVTAFVAVIPPLANLSSFLWVRLSHGRDKIRFVTTLQAMMIAAALAIAFVPINTTGLLTAAGAALLGRTCWAGVTTLRSTIWKLNYPDGARARITGKFAMITVLMAALLALGLGKLMNANPNAFRVLVPIGCAIALIGRYQWTRMRLRGARSLVDNERSADKRDGPSFNPARMVSVLTNDHRYAAYMLCQFLLGIGNIVSIAILAIVLREVFEVDYAQGLLLSTTIQFGVMPFCIPLWARFLDGTHIVRFRAVHSWVFVAAQCFLLAAIVFDQFYLLFGFSLLKGIAFGGGVLGWTLGHLDFATKDQSSQYMGVHVTLTGVRGLIAAFLAAPMYVLLSDALGEPGSPDIRAGAAASIGICLSLTVAGGLGFLLMQRHFAKRGLFERKGVPEPVQPTQVDR